MQEFTEKKAGKSDLLRVLPQGVTNAVFAHIAPSDKINKNSRYVDSESLSINQKTITVDMSNLNPKTIRGVFGSFTEKKRKTVNMHTVKRYRPAIEGGRRLIEPL